MIKSADRSCYVDSNFLDLELRWQLPSLKFFKFALGSGRMSIESGNLSLLKRRHPTSISALGRRVRLFMTADGFLF